MLERRLLLWSAAHAKKRRPKKRCHKVLVVRTDGVGDYILWLSVEKKIKQLYPDARMELLFDKRKPSPQIARYDQAVDRYFSMHIVTWKRFVSVVRMYFRSYDTIIQPVYARLAFTDILVFAARASERITIGGSRQFFLSETEWKWANRGYDRIIRCRKGTRHELLRCAELARGLGAEDCRACLPDMTGIRLPAKVMLSAKNAAKTYILIFPSASFSGKVWEAEKFAQITQWLLERFQGIVYLCGDKQDVPACRRIRQLVRPAQRCRLAVLAGRLNLAQLAAWIKGAAFVFGNDTGAIHLAAAYRVRAAAIVAAREIGRFFPYAAEYPQEDACFPFCIYQEHLACSGCLLRGEQVCRYREQVTDTFFCISSISVRQVIQALERIFGAPPLFERR